MDFIDLEIARDPGIRRIEIKIGRDWKGLEGMKGRRRSIINFVRRENKYLCLFYDRITLLNSNMYL